MPKSEAGKLIGYGAAATALGGAYKFGEFLYKAKRLRDVGPSNAVYVRIINRVRQDLDEVKRLLTVPEIKEALKENPPKAKWVYGAMRDVRGALENIAPHTERVGSDLEAGRRVGLRHRFYWLLSEKEKLENREKEVTAAHGSLMEVIGFLTALEPVDGKHAHDKAHGETHGEAHSTHDTRNTKIDVDIRHSGPERVEERDVWIERRDGGPQRIVEERETIIEHDHRGPRHHDEREYRFERHHEPRRHDKPEYQFVRRHEPRHGEHHVKFEHEHRGPRHVEEREEYYQDERDVRRVERDYQVDDRGRPLRYDERETWVDRGRDSRHEAPYDERELHIERDPRDPRHVEARYTERGPNHYEEKRYEERRFGGEPLGRRPESFEDRLPERDTWMQSDVQSNAYGRNESRRRFIGDPGFGDEEVLNPQLVPFEREIWVEEKEDLTRDKYGNKLPERFQETRYPMYPRDPRDPRSRV